MGQPRIMANYRSASRQRWRFLLHKRAEGKPNSAQHGILMWLFITKKASKCKKSTISDLYIDRRNQKCEKVKIGFVTQLEHCALEVNGQHFLESPSFRSNSYKMS